ncbi:MAG: fasciclin domain-containing protein [Balneolaceae bacterium]|jgi:uncharacterized surface protein with fasciclin (FAS1) repeats
MKIVKTLSVLLMSLLVFAFTSNLKSEKTISEMVAENQDLSTLLTALQSADLVETLKGEGPYTVFAPTNEAFNNLPAGKLDDLLKPENKEELAKILKYHVVSGEVYASDLEDGQMLETLEGNKIKVSIKDSPEEGMEGEESMAGVKINNANVVTKDVMASNGIIHIIDGVVMPSDLETIGELNQ